MAIIRKWQIWGEKGKFGQKWRVCEKLIKGLAKYSNDLTKRGILTNGDFKKITNLVRIYRFGKIKTGGMSIIVGFTKMTNFAKLANLDLLKVWHNFK